MIIRKDILLEIKLKNITIDEAYSFYETIMDSDQVSNIKNLMCLNNYEWTAFCQGLPLETLSDWRYKGWPNKCIVTGQNISIEGYHWLVKKKKGKYGLFSLK